MIEFEDVGNYRGCLQIKNDGDRPLRIWAFIRPYCHPGNGTVQAYSAEEAMGLVHEQYGFASNTSVYCAETKERLKDKS